ncbi:MAG: 4-hydroxybenzoate octaprenyltransferase [Gammaproteobacteria bacterium]|nr:4-hydroxybenzoate octaprenyltransferase [Gammaproteobacteria bacterium]
MVSGCFSPYLRLMRLDKPVGTYLVLLPALMALWLASEGVPPLWELAVFVLGAFVMRSAGCVINDYADRDWDGAVARTCDRPLACGEVSPKAALMLFAGLLLLGGVLVLTLRTEVLLWALGAVVLATLYPFTKRWVYYPQLFLGLAFAWAIPMGFVAVLGEMPADGWWLFAVTVVWALIYDTWYALVDRDDDLKVGIKSTAILFGRYLGVIMALFMLLMLWLLLQLGEAFALSWLWSLVVLLVAFHFAWQLWLVREGEREAVFRAFKSNIWIGVMLWLGVLVSYL